MKIQNLILTAFVAAGLVLSADAALSAKSYVAPGLINHWDGIENVSYGAAHNSAATTWKDLTGKGFALTKPSGSSFSDKGLTTVRANGSEVLSGDNWKKTKMYEAFKNASYTCEVVYNQPEAVPAASTGYRYKFVTMFILGNDNALIGISDNKAIGFNPNNIGRAYDVYTGSYKSLTTSVGEHSFACIQDGTKAWVSVDGSASSKLTVTTGTPGTVRGFKFNRCYYADHGLPGTYYAIRCYNRPLTTDEVAVNRAVDQVRYFGVDAATITLPTGWRWTGSGDALKLEKQLAVTIKDDIGGTVTVNGTPLASATLPWIEQSTQTSLTLTATADDGYVFSGWSTVDEAVSGDRYAASTTLTVGENLMAVFRKTDGTDTRSYTANGGVWNVNTTWTDEYGLRGIPAAKDNAVIPSGLSVVVTNATPQLASLEVAGTLNFSNEMVAVVKADTISIPANGLITAATAETVEKSFLTQRIHCVQLVCKDLTIAANGKIDVAKKGWLSYPTATLTGNAYMRGFGPGSVAYANSSDATGPAHGGSGSRKGLFAASNAATLARPQVYDDPRAPMLPGSSGASQQWGRGGYGGGYLSVKASGTVTVNGSILADGGTTGAHKTTSTGPNHDCAGSGGSVYLVCQTISGNGVISAEGGGGDYPDVNGPGMAAGGGCIAIHYETTLQTSAMVAGMRISAADGTYLHKDYNPGRVGELAWQYDPDIGTVWFSDDKIVAALLGNGLMGQIKNVTNYTHAGDLAFNYGHVRFAEEGANVTVAGNLTFGGSDSRLEIGGCVETNRSMYTEIFGGRKVNRLTVGGDLRLAGVSRLDIRAAETNGVDAYGAVVTVGGTMTIETNCFVYAWSDIRNGGAPRFVVGNLTVATGGVFSADWRGGSGSRYSDYYAYGNSSGKNGSMGGGHGGKGGRATATQGCANDDALRPSLPGSGGGSQGTAWAVGGRGGGVVTVAATNGTIRVDGKITAKGGASYRYGGGGAGGTILLDCAKLTGSTNGVITADGGTSVPESGVYSGAGGGGRVSIFVGQPWSKELHRVRIKTQDTPFALETYPKEFLYRGTATAAGGKVTGDYAASNGTDGDAGTVRFSHIRGPKGMRIIFR